MEKLLRDKKAISIFVLPAFLIFIFTVYFPIFFSFYYSLTKWNGFGAKHFIWFDNYINLFRNDPIFVKSVLNSLILVVLSVGIQVPLALFLALLLSSRVKGEAIFRTIYFIPAVISTVVIGQLWSKIYDAKFGLLNKMLSSLGLDSWINVWLGDPKTALGAVFVPIVWQYIGYHMLLLYAGAKSISNDIYEAAKIDGATPLRMAIHITIPLIMPVIRVSVILALIGSLKIFDNIYVMTNGGPFHSTEVPSTLMFNTIFNQYLYGYGSSMAIFIILECLVFTAVIMRFFRTEQNY